jgi:cytochrome c556
MRTRWIVVGLALAACQCESGPKPSRNSAPLLTASVPGAGADVHEHMAAHLDAAYALQAAIAQGRLGDARDQAAWFATHDMDVPPAWQPYVDDMRGAAIRIKAADDVAGAGLELGRLGHACGSCHEAQHARVAQAYFPAPADGATLELQMARHTWAATRLWQGVIGPTDELWVEGARAMATTRFDILGATHEKPNAEVIELAERLHTQAEQAIVQTEHASRAQLYGEMMETCASCHRIVRPHPVARH